MTQVIPFVPQPTELFQFLATMDGGSVTVIISWNLFGQRWYVNLFDTSGVLVAAFALVSSPDDRDINLVAGYYQTSTMVFRDSTNQFEISP